MFSDTFQSIIYTAYGGRQKQEIRIISKAYTNGCGLNQEENKRVDFEVPAISPTDFSTSKIAQIRYLIRVREITLTFLADLFFSTHFEFYIVFKFWFL